MGDLDIPTFESLVNYLTSYKVSSKSSLSTLSIKLLNIITCFNKEIKLIFRKLFNIKIKSLLELKLCTNLIIDNRNNYLYLIKILKNNWIPTYVIKCNEKTDNYIFTNRLYYGNISFLISNAIKDTLLQNNQIDLNCKRDEEFPTDENIFWILKYIFSCKYCDNSMSFFEIKNLGVTILKYLFFTSNAKISYILEEPKKDG